MHQLLHLTGRNRGGNGDKAAFNGRTTSACLLLYACHNSIPTNHTRRTSITCATRFSSRNASARFPKTLYLSFPSQTSNHTYLRDTIYEPYVQRIVWEGFLGKWKDKLDEWLVCPPFSCALTCRQGQARRPSSSHWRGGTGTSAKMATRLGEKPIHKQLRNRAPSALDIAPYAASDNDRECWSCIPSSVLPCSTINGSLLTLGHIRLAVVRSSDGSIVYT
ncbi:hypothetical protein V8E55_001364 [Tylopilus felleus]